VNDTDKKSVESRKKDAFRVSRKGRSFFSEHFILRAVPGDGKEKILAVSVPARMAPRAVTRNRIRRRVSEIIRRLDKPHAHSFIGTITLRNAQLPAHGELKNELMLLLRKSAILGT